MFKFSFKLCFISLFLLFNIPSFSSLVAQEEEKESKVEDDSGSNEASTEENVEKNDEDQAVKEESEEEPAGETEKEEPKKTEKESEQEETIPEEEEKESEVEDDSGSNEDSTEENVEKEDDDQAEKEESEEEPAGETEKEEPKSTEKESEQEETIPEEEEKESEFEDDSSAADSMAEGETAEEEAAESQKEKTEEKSAGEAGAEELKVVEEMGIIEEPVEQAVEKTTEPEKEDIEVKEKTEEVTPDKPVVESEESVQPEPESVKIESVDTPVEQAVESVQDQGPQGLDRIELQEQDTTLVKTDDVGKKLKEVLKQAKAIGKDINNIADRLREIRNKLHAKYHNDVDKYLDELLQRMGFDSGEAKGKDRFKLLHSAVKSEYENEWEQIKKEANEIDSLENQVFEKLKVLDNKYENAVQISIESRKLNLNFFNVSDVSKLEAVLTKLQEKQQAVKKIEKEITETLEKEFNLLITLITEKFKKVDGEFKELEQKGRDLDAYQKTLEKAEEEKRNQLPKWRQVIEGIVDRALDSSSVVIKKTKGFFDSFYSKIVVFINDVKEKSKQTKENNESIEVVVNKPGQDKTK